MKSAVSDQNKTNKPSQNKPPYRQQQIKPNNRVCRRCGDMTNHQKTNCPAMGKTCTKCKKPNHFAKMCLSVVSSPFPHGRRGKHKVHQIDELDSDYEDEFFVGTIDTDKNSSENDWKVQLSVNDVSVDFKIDTGAQCNVISKHLCDKIGLETSVRRNKTKLVSYSGHEIKTCGFVKACVGHKDKYHLIDIHVVNANVASVVGLPTSLDMNLIKRVYSVQTEQDQSNESTAVPPSANSANTKELLHKYEHLFSGIGCLPGEYEIKIDPFATPVVSPPRRIPHTLKDKVKQELERMEQMNIITKVEEPTTWVNPIVVVKKPNGKVRICLDPRELNKAILREHYLLKTVEEVAATLKDATVFTTLDAASGFYQIKLKEESTWLTTFNTPFGRYKFERLPFGISSAPEIFQRTMAQVFDAQPSEEIIDNIMIWGKDARDHEAKLAEVLARADEVGLWFNKQKCKMKKPEVEYVGHVFSKDGVRPTEDRVKAIKNLPKPENKKDLQRFMGMVNYLGKFIKNLSTVNQPLRELLENNVEWHWSERHDKAINDLKEAITTAPVLRYYDVNAPIKLSVDASSYGLGGYISQEAQPVAYASRSLNSAERNYAQIEKEMLAIVFGLTKFHEYVYGKEVEIETDHKPLESLFRKPLSCAPQRIQRMMLKIQQYQVQVKYKPGKELYIADTLSRAAQQTTGSEVEEEFEVHVVDSLPISTMKTREFQVETENDEVLGKLRNAVLQGWPESKRELDPDLTPYWNVRDEVSICDGLLFKGDRIITPVHLQSEMLQRVHSSHLGVEKCLARARELLYWPGMTSQIKDKVAQCGVCNKYRNKQSKQPLLPHDIPDRPWQKVASDVFHLNGVHYVVLVDYFSKFFEITQIGDLKSSTIVQCLKQHFARYGIPEVFVSDNGPKYSSADFANFARNYDFCHRTSSPRYPQSNGLAERTVQTAKKLLTKAIADGQDPHLALLALRNTPLSDIGLSPVQLLMGRRTRTVLPTKPALLKQSGVPYQSVKNALERKQNTQKKFFDKGSKPLPPLDKGDSVRMRSNDNTWKPAQITNTPEKQQPRSYKVRSEGKFYRRNRKDLLATRENRVNNDDDQVHSEGASAHSDCVQCDAQSGLHDSQSVIGASADDSHGRPIPSSGVSSQLESVKSSAKLVSNLTTQLDVEPRVTRSGRCVNAPARFQDYVS